MSLSQRAAGRRWIDRLEPRCLLSTSASSLVAHTGVFNSAPAYMPRWQFHRQETVCPLWPVVQQPVSGGLTASWFPAD